jgi:hypothetical protein
MSGVSGNFVPSGCEPVRMSCMFGVSPRPLTTGALLGERGLFRQVVGAVQLGDVLRDDDTFGIGPRPFADAGRGH